MDGYYIQLLEFLKPEIGVPKEIAINNYIKENFKKPPLGTTWENDTASLILKYLLNKKFIEIKGDPFPQIGNAPYAIDGEIQLRWWDDATEDTLAKITNDGLDYLKTERNNDILLQTTISTRKANASSIRTNKSVISNNINTFKILLVTVLISLINLGLVIKNYFNDTDKAQLRALIQQQNKQLSEQQLLINQQQLILSHLIELKKKP